MYLGLVEELDGDADCGSHDCAWVVVRAIAVWEGGG